MAAWGTGSFENEDAASWLADLTTKTPHDLTEILVEAVHHSGYLQARAASLAVAAAEVISELNPAPDQAVPKEIVEWRKKNPQASTPELKTLALRALDRVRKNSELKDLWLEADGLNEWTAAIHNLEARLGS